MKVRAGTRLAVAACAVMVAGSSCGLRDEARRSLASPPPRPGVAATASPTATAPAPAVAGTVTATPTRTPAPAPTPTGRTVRSASPSPVPARPTAAPSPTPSPSPSPTLGPGQTWLPSHGSKETSRHALDARVAGNPGQRCVWLLSPNGTMQAALWPAGYRARFAPVRIYDERDRLVWQESDPVRRISGGPSTVHVDRIPPPCRTGDLAWWVPDIA